MSIFILGMVLIQVDSLEVSAAGTTYYVSDTDGDDSNVGTSTSTPWKTLLQVSGITFNAGDQILLKKGDTWTGQTLTLHGNGTGADPITLSSYGTGNNPKIEYGTSTDKSCIEMDEVEGWKIVGLDIGKAAWGINIIYDKTTGSGNESKIWDYIWIEDCYL